MSIISTFVAHPVSNSDATTAYIFVIGDYPMIASRLWCALTANRAIEKHAWRNTACARLVRKINRADVKLGQRRTGRKIRDVLDNRNCMKRDERQAIQIIHMINCVR